MSEPDDLDIDTYTRTNYYIRLLESTMRLTERERRDIALLLRRYRKAKFGSALTDEDRAAGRAEINP